MPCDDCSRAETCPPCVSDLDEITQVEAEILGLDGKEAAWLDIARLCVERLNASLERKYSPHRWNVLSNSDPRRKRK